MLEIARFLASHSPFSGLGPSGLDELIGTIEVEYFPAGTRILQRGGSPASHIYVIRRGKVELHDGDRPVDLLEEGDIFGFASLLADQPPVFDARADEDTLCYLVPRAGAEKLLGTLSGARFIAETLRRRHGLDAAVAPILDVITVGEIARSPLVVVGSDRSVQDVARAMTEVGATAAVVLGSTVLGIVTDRDLRARVMATGRDPLTTIGEVATFPARTVPASGSAGSALVDMLDLGVHHLPVTHLGEVVGMLGDLDLLDLDRRQVVCLRSEIERAEDLEAAVTAGSRIPDALSVVAATGADPDHVGLLAAVLHDTLTKRIIDLAIDDLGPPPGRWAWLALGSGGRREQSLVTDQDHALIHGDEVEDADPYFPDLAGRVVTGLEAAGIPRCESKVMASEEGWRGSESWWRRRFGDWTTEPEHVAAFLTSIAFDLRRVAGELDPGSIVGEAIRSASANPGFLRRLARLAVSLDIPVGFFGGLVVHERADGTEVLDIKTGGLLAITEFARVFAVRAGLPSVGTVERLHGAADAGELSTSQADGLVEAFRVFGEIRLAHQVSQMNRGEKPDNLVDLGQVNSLARRSLRDAFRLVREVQKELAESVVPRVPGR